MKSLKEGDLIEVHGETKEFLFFNEKTNSVFYETYDGVNPSVACIDATQIRKAGKENHLYYLEPLGGHVQ